MSQAPSTCDRCGRAFSAEVEQLGDELAAEPCRPTAAAEALGALLSRPRRTGRRKQRRRSPKALGAVLALSSRQPLATPDATAVVPVSSPVEG